MRAIWIAISLCLASVVDAQEPITFAACTENDTVIRQARIAAIRDEILAKLHLTEPPPNPRKLTAINKSTLSAYRAAVQTANRQSLGRSRECRRDTFFAKLLSVYFPTSYRPVIPPADMFEWGALFKDETAKRGVDAAAFQEVVPPVSYKITFELQLPSDTLIWASDLRLFKRKKINNLRIKQNHNAVENVEVYYVSRKKNKDGKEVKNFVLVSSKDVSSEDDGYESFDVTQAVRKWATESLVQKMELEVVIKCPEFVSTGLALLPSIEFVVGNDNKENRTAQLVIATVQEEEREPEEKNSVVGRRKRQTAVNSKFCLSNPQEPNCCLRRLEINFKKDLGWSWILAPRSFVPNFCQGLCPFFWPSATMSTTLLIQYSSMNPTAAVEPCCVAAVMKPLTLLMVINGRIFLNELSDMIIDSCICR